MGSCGGVFAASAYVGGTCELDVLPCACDMLEISVVRGVCDIICLCLARVW